MNRIRVLVADDIEETRKTIGKILMLENKKFELVGEAGNGEEVLKQIPLCKPDVILMDINMPVMNGLEATEKIGDLYPNISVIIMSVQAENEYLKKAMFSGAKEYIIKPVNYDTLVNTIEATFAKNQERQSHLPQTIVQDKNAKVYSFYSAKGGVGKSVVSVNTALTISKNFKKKTLLVDLDLQYGDLGLMLNLHNKKTILDLIDDHQLDSYETMSPYLSRVNDCLDVLLAPDSPEGGEYIHKDAIEKLLKLCSKHYDFIIIDTAVNFEETTLYALDVSQNIFLVTTMELSSIKNTKLGLNVMKTLNYDEKKVKVIVNAAKEKFGISEKEVSEIFKSALFAILPEDAKNIRNAVNTGNPSANQKGTTVFTKKILDMCKKML